MKISKIWFDGDRIYGLTDDGRTLCRRASLGHQSESDGPVYQWCQKTIKGARTTHNGRDCYHRQGTSGYIRITFRSRPCN